MNTLLNNAWSTKLFFSFLSDSVPVFGYRRLPYILFSLFIIIVCKITMFVLPMPEPYFESVHNGDTCFRNTSSIINPDAPNMVVSYAMLFFVAYLSMAWSDCTIDGLLTQRSMLEPEGKRGSLMAQVKIGQKIASAVIGVFLALMFNKVEYGGSFCAFGLDFNQIALIVAIGAMITTVYAFFFTNERDFEPKTQLRLKENLQNIWKLIQTTHFIKLLIFKISVAVLYGIRVSITSTHFFNSIFYPLIA